MQSPCNLQSGKHPGGTAVPPAIPHSPLPKRILVVQGDLAVSHTIREALTRDGHLVEVAHNGRQALGLFYSRGYDLVITEFRTAEIDGIGLAKVIKKLCPATPVILLASGSGPALSYTRRMPKVDFLLLKPVSAVDVQAALLRFFPAR